MNSLFRLFCFALSAFLSSATHAGPAVSGGLKSGEQVYEEVCSACHSTGVAHAPIFKNKESWAPLIAEGQPVLTGQAWVGMRAMPAKGGEPTLQLVEFARAVAWMTNQSGSDWKEPDTAMMRKIMGEAEKQLDKSIQEAQIMKKELQKRRSSR